MASECGGSIPNEDEPGPAASISFLMPRNCAACSLQSSVSMAA
jgi:hypothetical protein